MNKAQEIILKARQRAEEAAAVQTYWSVVCPGLGEIPAYQLQGWQGRYDINAIIAGIDAAVILNSKKDGKGEIPSVAVAVAYASGAMRDAHFDGMSDDERQEYVDKAKDISLKRSIAAHKRWDKEREIAPVSNEGASACMPLHAFASNLHTDGVGVGYGVGANGCDVAFAGEDDGSASQSPSQIYRKEEDKPKTQTIPAGVSGVSANQQTTPKVKTLKTAKGVRPKPEGFDSWTNVERTEWIMCTCDADQDFEEPHRPHCAVKPQAEAKAAAASEGYNIPLGNVDEL